jgi:dihydroorotate dehydrogenase
MPSGWAFQAAHRLVPETIKMTPDLSFKNTQTLATFMDQNQAAILAETHTVPETFQGAPSLAGAVGSLSGPLVELAPMFLFVGER